jgi:hypothetical protein
MVKSLGSQCILQNSAPLGWGWPPLHTQLQNCTHLFLTTPSRAEATVHSWVPAAGLATKCKLCLSSGEQTQWKSEQCRHEVGGWFELGQEEEAVHEAREECRTGTGWEAPCHRGAGLWRQGTEGIRTGSGWGRPSSSHFTPPKCALLSIFVQDSESSHWPRSSDPFQAQHKPFRVGPSVRHVLEVTGVDFPALHLEE